MAIVAYKNRNTGQVVAFPGENGRLEALNEWDRVDADEVTLSIADAHDRAQAERESIEAAAAIRFDTAAGAAAAGLAHAAAINTAQAAGSGSTPGPIPTLSTGDAGEKQQPVALLAKDDELRDSATTSFEENKREAEREIENPPQDGVLARAKRDHRKGRTQIGPNPEEHAGPKAAKAAGGDDDSEDTGAGDEQANPATVPAVDDTTGNGTPSGTVTGF